MPAQAGVAPVEQRFYPSSVRVRLPPPAVVKHCAALLVTGFALAAAGCIHGDEEASPSRASPPLVEKTVVEGGSRRERALLQRVVNGMKKTTIKRITIAPAASRRATNGAKAVAIRYTSAPGMTTRRQWDQWIVAGAFSRRLAAARLPAQVDAGDERGGFTARPRLKGNPDPRPLNPRKAGIVKGIDRAARKSGGAVVRLEVHQPYGVAIALSVAAKDPADFLKTRLRPLLRSLDTYRRRLEGVYVAVLDEELRLVLEWGSWTRNPAGSYWVRNDLTNCSPIRQSAPPGEEPPPPCPT
jgi:hypothetical protein